jgi:hypothetical protein
MHPAPCTTAAGPAPHLLPHVVHQLLQRLHLLQRAGQLLLLAGQLPQQRLLRHRAAHHLCDVLPQPRQLALLAQQHAPHLPLLLSVQGGPLKLVELLELGLGGVEERAAGNVSNALKPR